MPKFPTQIVLLCLLTLPFLLINLTQSHQYSTLSQIQSAIRQIQLRNKIVERDMDLGVGMEVGMGMEMGRGMEQGGDVERLGGGLGKIGFGELEFGKQMENYCQIPIKDATYHLFQSPRNSYILVNNPQKSTTQIYNSQCHQITQIKNLQVKQVLCDRGLCDDGTVVFITQPNTEREQEREREGQNNGNSYSDGNRNSSNEGGNGGREGETVVMCNQMRNFTDCVVLARLGNFVKGTVVGGVVRNRGNGGIQTYIADSAGQIIVLDGQGKLRLTVSLQPDNKITHFLDIHPYPLLISSRNWLYTFQNTKYTITLTKCPYLFHPIDRAFVSHPYSSYIYAMSDMVVSRIQVKTQPKGCQIGERVFVGGVEGMGKGERDGDGVGLAEYQGRLYVGNKVVNFDKKEVLQFVDCGNDTVFNFQPMKNNYRKGFFTLKCTHPNKTDQSLLIFKPKNTEQSSSKNNTIIMVVILLLVIFLIFMFLRSTTPNLDYDEELKYNHNLKYKMEVDEVLMGQRDRGGRQGRQGREGKEKEKEKGVQGKRMRREHSQEGEGQDGERNSRPKKDK